MNNDQVEITRINARQAITVAAIGAVAGVVTTLLGTALAARHENDRTNQPPVSSASSVAGSSPQVEQLTITVDELRRKLAQREKEIADATQNDGHNEEERLRKANSELQQQVHRLEADGAAAAHSNEEAMATLKTRNETLSTELASLKASTSVPHIGFGIETVSVSASQCLKSATVALKNSGAVELVDRNSAVFAQRGSYKVAIACYPSVGAAMIYSAGPDRDGTFAVRDQIGAQFRAAMAHP